MGEIEVSEVKKGRVKFVYVDTSLIEYVRGVPLESFRWKKLSTLKS